MRNYNQLLLPTQVNEGNFWIRLTGQKYLGKVIKSSVSLLRYFEIFYAHNFKKGNLNLKVISYDVPVDYDSVMSLH